MLNWVIPCRASVLLATAHAQTASASCFRHRMSHTLKQKPEELNGYDKQHFSDEPHFNNPTFNMEDPEISDGKQRTYIVNEEQTMEDIKLDRST